MQNWSSLSICTPDGIGRFAPEVSDILKQFYAEYRAEIGYTNRALYPVDEWVQRLLDIGAVIENYVDYATYLEDRWYLYHAHGAPEKMERLKSCHRLGDDASWVEVVDAKIREHVRHNQLLKKP